VALLKAGRLARLGVPAEVITYGAVTEVYETEVYVDVNDVTGAVNVLPLGRAYREACGAEPGVLGAHEAAAMAAEFRRPLPHRTVN